MRAYKIFGSALELARVSAISAIWPLKSLTFYCLFSALTSTLADYCVFIKRFASCNAKNTAHAIEIGLKLEFDAQDCSINVRFSGLTRKQTIEIQNFSVVHCRRAQTLVLNPRISWKLAVHEWWARKTQH